MKKNDNPSKFNSLCITFLFEISEIRWRKQEFMHNGHFYGENLRNAVRLKFHLMEIGVLKVIHC